MYLVHEEVMLHSDWCMEGIDSMFKALPAVDITRLAIGCVTTLQIDNHFIYFCNKHKSIFQISKSIFPNTGKVNNKLIFSK